MPHHEHGEPGVKRVDGGLQSAGSPHGVLVLVTPDPVGLQAKPLQFASTSGAIVSDIGTASFEQRLSLSASTTNVESSTYGEQFMTQLGDEVLARSLQVAS